MRGLWYFFGIVIAAGIFSGVAGLGLGYVAGVLWEQVHRHRRQKRLQIKAIADAAVTAENSETEMDSPGQPRLQLVTVDAPSLPNIDDRILEAIRFRSRSIELDFGDVTLSFSGNPVVGNGVQRYRFPDPGSRDALCALIGDRVQSARSPSADRFDIRFNSGSDLSVARNAVAVA